MEPASSRWDGDRRATLCVRTPAHCTKEAIAACFAQQVGLSVRPKRGQRDPVSGLRGGVAFVVFADEAAAQAALASYDGSCGPAAKAFTPMEEPAERPGGPGWQPTLRRQLGPLSLAQLRERAQQLGTAEEARELEMVLDQRIQEGGMLAGHGLLVERLAGLHASRPRRVRQAEGMRIRPELCAELLAALEQTSWGHKERCGVSGVAADQYITIRKPWEGASHKTEKRVRQVFEKHQELWRAAARVMAACAPADYEYTSLAVTYNFRGSPHRDSLDQSYQFALSLGSFGESGGGRLCVESAADEVTYIDTWNRLACIDGRFPHWVEGYSGDRYSVIFYTVDQSHYVAPLQAGPLHGMYNRLVDDRLGSNGDSKV